MFRVGNAIRQRIVGEDAVRISIVARRTGIYGGVCKESLGFDLLACTVQRPPGEVDTPDRC